MSEIIQATAERDALRVEQGVRQSAEKTEAEMEELQSRYALLYIFSSSRVNFTSKPYIITNDEHFLFIISI